MPNIDQTNRDLPPAQGLYHPRNEHDACGLNFVCDMHGRKSHEIVAKAIGALCNLEHRGARGADINTGDGAGILIQVPDRFFRDVVAFDLPEAGAYATGMAFLPQEPSRGEMQRPERSSAFSRRKVSRCSAGVRCPSTNRSSERRRS